MTRQIEAHAAAHHKNGFIRCVACRRVAALACKGDQQLPMEGAVRGSRLSACVS